MRFLLRFGVTGVVNPRQASNTSFVAFVIAAVD
jgi:hypothetical protein